MIPRNVRLSSPDDDEADVRPKRRVEVPRRRRKSRSAGDDLSAPPAKARRPRGRRPEPPPGEAPGISANRRLPRPEPEPEPLEHAVTPLASVPPPADDDGPSRWSRVRGPLVRAAKVAALLLGVAGAVAVGRLTQDYVRTSSAFAIRTLEVSGAERLDDETVLRAAGLSAGMNVFELAPDDVRARLERHPWIARADVERRLPGTFRLRVEEHAPSLLLSLGDELYLVDDAGNVFKELAANDPVDLPILAGVDRARFVRDRAWRSALLLEALALLHDWRAAGLWRREPISEIRVEANDGLTLHVGDDAMQVRLGRAPFLPKLRKLRRVLDRLDAEETRAHYVHLDNVRRPDRVVVRLRQAATPASES